jgi:hypothetical protein
VPGDLVKTVDVLGDEGAKRAALFQGSERTVAGVWPRVPGRMLEAPPPRQLSNVGIGHVVVNVGQAFGVGIPCPDALRAAKIGNAGFG